MKISNQYHGLLTYF